MRTSSATTTDFVSGRTGAVFGTVTAALLSGMGFLALSLILAAPAGAAEFHPYKFSIDGTGTTAGHFLEVESVAVEQSTGTVYAFDRGTGVIDKFDAAGTPQNFTSTGTSSLNLISACPGFGIYQYGEEEIAVDNSGTANQGNIYAAAYNGGGVCAFNEAGEFLWRLSPEEDPKIGGACGVTTDSLGRVWVGSYGNGAMRYTATGSPPTLVAIAGSGSACRFALGPEGKIYMADVYGRGVERWTVVGFEKQITSNGYGVIYDSASEHLFVTANDQVDEYTTEGVLLSETGRGAPFDQTGIGTMSNATGVAVRESTGDLYVAARGSNIVNVYGPLGAFPDVTTGNASQITRTGATVAGEVVPAGGNVSSCQVEWGSSTAYGNTTSCAQPTPFAGPTPVSASLSGLAAGATYHYRIVAANEAGANYSGDQTFTTNFVDGVTTGAATDISRSEATLDGSLEPSGIDAHYYFEWGIDQGYGSTTPVPPGTDAGSGVGIAAASAAVGSLQFGTTYHYRLVASNADGTNYGQDQTFRTLDAVVGLETTAATGMTQTGATLNGKLDPDGLATTYYFEWGPTTAYGTNAPSGPPGASAGGGLGITAVSAPIDGLSSYTTYHYRLVATNSVGTTYGADQTLTTQPPLLPVISETSASNLGANSATLSAQINPGFGQTVYRFQYGRDASYEFRTPPIGPLSDDNVDHPVSLDVTELVAGVTYHYRVVATNFAGVTRGPDRTFTTESPPKIESASATSVTPHGARIEVQVNPGFAATTFHVEYGDGLALATPESGVIGADGGNHAGSVDLAALNAGTTYHYEVVASNAIGTTTGQDQTFTTPAEQTSLPPPPVVKCKKGTVRRHGKCVKKPRRHQKRHNRGRS